MKRKLRFVLVSIAFLSFASESIQAAEVTPITGDDWIGMWIALLAQPGDTGEKLRRRMILPYGMIDYDGGGISAYDYRMRRETKTAKSRAGMLKEWIEQDLNADGRVTRRELERNFFSPAQFSANARPTGYRTPSEQFEREYNRLIKNALAADANKDDEVDFDEALDYANRVIARNSPTNAPDSLEILLHLDENSDGAVSLNEFLAAVDDAFERIDTNGDGKFSAEEVTAHKQIIAELRRAIRAEERARKRMQKDSK